MTHKTKIYIDTSVYIPVLLNQPEAKKVIKITGNKLLCSSSILLIETERNLIRLSREKEITAEEFAAARNQLLEDRNTFLLRDVTPDLALTGEFPATLTPRSNDLIHLRTALWFFKNGLLNSFFTFDLKQKSAAEELGLKILEL